MLLTLLPLALLTLLPLTLLTLLLLTLLLLTLLLLALLLLALLLLTLLLLALLALLLLALLLLALLLLALLLLTLLLLLLLLCTPLCALGLCSRGGRGRHLGAEGLTHALLHLPGYLGQQPPVVNDLPSPCIHHIGRELGVAGEHLLVLVLPQRRLHVRVQQHIHVLFHVRSLVRRELHALSRGKGLLDLVHG